MIAVRISAHDHEEARVASAVFALPGASLPALERELAKQLAVTVRWAEERDLLIGHAKAYIRWGEEAARMLSTTGGPVEVKGSGLPKEPCEAEAGVTVIVFGTELEEVEERLEGLAAAVAGQFGDWCAFEHECEHEHHHHDHDHEHPHDRGGEREEPCG